MPAPPVVIGQEFEAMSISNGDGGSLTIFVTVVDAAGNFLIRGVQTGPSSGILTIQRGALGPLVIDCAPGSRALIRLQDSVAIGVPWSIVATRLSIQGGARPFVGGH